MIRALLKKELREHFLLAVVGLALAIVAVALHLQPPARLSAHFTEASLWRIALGGSVWGSYYRELPVPITDGSYLGKLAVLCYLLGGGLGFLISWKEELRKTWPFLLHRPVRRSEVLLAKLSAGAILYLPATLVPFLFLCWWSSVPGHYPAPWCFEFVYPGLELIARGYVIFLGAFVCGCREAKWHGTRLAPLAGTASFMWVIGGSWGWVGAVGFLLVATALTLCALWHVFLGVRKLRVALALLNAIGIAGALYGVSLIPRAIIHRETRDREWAQAQFSPEGEPQLVVSRLSDRTLKTLDGEIIEEGLRPGDPRVSLVVSLVGERPPWRWLRRWQPGTRSPPVEYVSTWSGDKWSALYTLWRDNLLASYDRDRGVADGYWGRDGFAAARGSAAPFPSIVKVTRVMGERTGSAYVVTDGGVFRLDQEEEKVTPLLLSPAFSLVPSFHGEKDRIQALVYVRGPRSIVACGADGENPRQFSLPEQLDRVTWIRAILLDDETLGLAFDPEEIGGRASRTWKRKDHLLKLNREGSVLWEKEIVLPGGRRRDEALRVFNALVPGAMPLACAAGAVDRAIEGRESTWTSRQWLLMFGKALICAVVALLVLRGRTRSSVANVAWSVVVFVSGIGGLLAVWAELSVEKPAPCPSCGRKRLPSMPQCPHCQADWPLPEKRDTDIFSEVG